MSKRLANYASIFQSFFKNSPSNEDQILANLLDKCDRAFKFDENKSIISAPYKAFKIKTDKNELIELRLINNESNFKFEKSIKYSQEIWEKAEVIFSKLCIEPTDDLIKDVNDALGKETTKKRLNALREISEKYGSFYACRLIFGKAKVKVVKHAESSDESLNTNSSEVQSEVRHTVIANVDLNASYRTQNESRSFDSYSTLDAKEIGNLVNYTTWAIIGYDEIKLIFDLLDDNLRKNVLDVLGHRILSSGFVNLESDFENSSPCTYRL
ncbi:hypothetical protein C2G38_2233230 [Gigaspora rosea]|uniref:MACPF domain-containing protein n=1 Tax=Gigaspora rosea TaxID=44941 RepID=A0A397TSF8_9GLOM|nr:hypothetical protein C2G38_2233230 [Gigaspora rosea]